MKKLRWGFVQILGVAIYLAHSAGYGVRWEEVEGHVLDGKQLLCLYLSPSDWVGYIPAASADPRAPKLEEKDDAIYLHSTQPWIEEQPHRFESQERYESKSGMTSEGEKAFEELEDFETPGHDRRKPVQPFTEHYRTIVCLKLFFPERDPTKPAVGTGVIIGPHHVLTVGHNIFDRNLGKTVEKIEVLSGLDFPHCYFGKQEVVKAYLFKNWKEGAFDSESSYDIALLLLDCSVGSQTGLCGLAAYRGSIPNQPISLYGYAGIWKSQLNDKLVGMESKGENVSSDEGNISYRKVDSSGGQSGSPLMQKGENESPYAIGVHRAGLSVGNNVGTRLTEAMLTSFIHPILRDTWKLDLDGDGTYEHPRQLLKERDALAEGAVQTCIVNDQLMVFYDINSSPAVSKDGRSWYSTGSGVAREGGSFLPALSFVSFRDRIYLSFEIRGCPKVYSSQHGHRSWRKEKLSLSSTGGQYNLVLVSFREILWAIFNSNAKIFTVFSPNGNDWEEERPISDWQTGLPISFTVHNGKLFAAYVGISENRAAGDVFLSWSEDGIVWQQPKSLSDWKSNVSVSLASHGDKLFAGCTGTDGRVDLSFTSDDGGSWSSLEQIKNWETNYPVHLISFNGKLRLFYIKNILRGFRKGYIYYASTYPLEGYVPSLPSISTSSSSSSSRSSSHLSQVFDDEGESEDEDFY